MSYTIELGYPKKTRSKYLHYDIAKVRPFESGGTFKADFGSLIMHLELDNDTELDTTNRNTIRALAEASGISLASLQVVDDAGLVDASLNITGNYSRRIEEAMGSGLRDLYGQTGIVVAANLAILAANLADEEPDEDYWRPTDGNIKVVASTLIDWTFQHPEGTFYTLG
jgi:hypothetical protein